MERAHTALGALDKLRVLNHWRLLLSTHPGLFNDTGKQTSLKPNPQTLSPSYPI